MQPTKAFAAKVRECVADRIWRLTPHYEWDQCKNILASDTESIIKYAAESCIPEAQPEAIAARIAAEFETATAAWCWRIAKYVGPSYHWSFKDYLGQVEYFAKWGDGLPADEAKKALSAARDALLIEEA